MGYGPGNPGRPRGTSSYPYREDQERELVVKYIKQGRENAWIAGVLGWSLDEVRDTRAIFFPTKGLAQDYLKANALKLAIRIVEDANVEEAIGILERPNIGVLEPVQKGGGTKIGFFSNINMGSLGGVQPVESGLVIEVGEDLPVEIGPVPVPTSRLLPPAASIPAPAPAASRPHTARTGTGKGKSGRGYGGTTKRPAPAASRKK